MGNKQYQYLEIEDIFSSLEKRRLIPCSTDNSKCFDNKKRVHLHAIKAPSNLELDVEIRKEESLCEVNALLQRIANLKNLKKQEKKLTLVLIEQFIHNYLWDVNELQLIINESGLNKQKAEFSSSLAIGPMIIEFVTGKNIIIKEKKSHNAIVVFPIKKNVAKGFLAKKIAKKIFKWNTTKHSRRKFANCQTFINDILNSLGESPKNFYLKKVLGKIIKGKLLFSQDFRLRKKFCKKFEIQNEMKDFSNLVTGNHSGLDTYLIEIFQKVWEKDGSLGELKKTDEYQFLKAIDSAYWLKLESAKKIGKEEKDTDDGIQKMQNEPKKNENGVQCCPFGDPESKALPNRVFWKNYLPQK